MFSVGLVERVPFAGHARIGSHARERRHGALLSVSAARLTFAIACGAGHCWCHRGRCRVARARVGPLKPRRCTASAAVVAETDLAAVSHSLCKGHDGPACAAYVHLPFCRQHCRYCDFPIAVVGKGGGAESYMRSYVDCLVDEVAVGGAGAFAWGIGDSWCSEPLTSVYFGGGTPSLLPTEEFQRIFHALRQRFRIAATAEITVEFDPATFDRKKAEELVHMGINRASVGIQSLDDGVLRLCGRGHTADEAERAVKVLQDVGVANVSADLLSGVPGQSEGQLRHDVRAIVGLGVTHLSVYDLQFEAGTPFERRYPAPGAGGRPTVDLAAQLYTATHEELSRLGFEHYEISSYARLSTQGDGSCTKRSNFRSRHNQGYWRRQPYAAFGNGAASFVAGVRATRPRKVEDYCDWVRRGGPPEGLAEVSAAARDDPREPLCEALMLGLRTSDGIRLVGGSAPDLDACLVAAGEALQGWVDTGHAEVFLQKHGDGPVELRARLLPPAGFLVSDAVLSDAWAAVLRVPEPDARGCGPA